MDVHPDPGPSVIDDSTVLSVFHINIRSLRNKIPYLSNIASEYDIICVSETHLDENVNTSDLIDGYYPNPIRKDRNAHGGGLLIYVSERLLVKRQEQLEYNTESIWIKVIFPRLSLLICCVYRSPNCNDPFWDNFHHSVETAAVQSNCLLVLSDLNVDLLTEKRHKLLDIMQYVGLQNCISSPTRYGPTRHSLLDLILVKECSVVNSEVIDVDRTISDHNGVLVNIDVKINFKNSYNREIWDYKRGDFGKLNHSIGNFNWNEFLLDSNNVNQACEKFNQTYIHMAKNSIPTRVVTIRPNDKPWFNSELRREIRKRDRLRKQAIKKNSTAIYEKYRKQRNHVNNVKKAIKQAYYIDLYGLIDTYSSNNNQDFWKFARKITKSSQSISIPPLSDPVSGKIAINDNEKANLLNDYFVNISTIDDNDDETPPCPIRTQNSIDTINIAESDIVDVIKTLNTNKASGLDEISHHMLKNTVQTVIKPLITLFNMCLRNCIFPSVWKQARVMPIFKKGDANLASNYRPISLLSVVGKLFERIVHKYIHNFLLDNNLFYKYQSGFLPNNSTVYQLWEIYHSIVTGMEDKMNSCFIFCDVSKAFDRVWHKGLMVKLESHGINGSLLEFLRNYLSNRTQSVFVNSSMSTFKTQMPESLNGPCLVL